MSYITYITNRACNFIIRRSSQQPDQLINDKISFTLDFINKVNHDIKLLDHKSKHSLLISTSCAGFWLEYNRNFILKELQIISKTLKLDDHVSHDTIMILDSFDRNVKLSERQTVIAEILTTNIVKSLDGKVSPKLRRLTHRHINAKCNDN
jgi:hypothetical protein